MSQTGKQLTLQCNMCTIGKNTQVLETVDRQISGKERRTEEADRQRALATLCINPNNFVGNISW